MNVKYIEEKDFLIESIREAYEKFGGHSGFNKTQKSKFDLVTDIDLNIERYLQAAISKKYPGDSFVGEEFSFDKSISGRTWIIDPIDGTCNMAHGIKTYGVQCALAENNELKLAVIYLPNENEVYYAIAGQGAYLNDKKISVSSDTAINNSIISFGDYSHKNVDYAKLQHSAVAQLYPRIAKIRMYGAACYDFSFVASGKTDATVVLTNNLWDLCPGILICSEAGGIISRVDGCDYKFGDFGVVISSNKNLHDEIIKAFKN